MDQVFLSFKSLQVKQMAAWIVGIQTKWGIIDVDRQ